MSPVPETHAAHRLCRAAAVQPSQRRDDGRSSRTSCRPKGTPSDTRFHYVRTAIMCRLCRPPLPASPPKCPIPSCSLAGCGESCPSRAPQSSSQAVDNTPRKGLGRSGICCGDASSSLPLSSEVSRPRRPTAMILFEQK